MLSLKFAHLYARDHFNATRLALQTPQHRLSFQLHFIHTAQEQHHIVANQSSVQC